MPQNDERLSFCHGGKPVHKLVNGGARLKVLKQRRNWHARTGEQPLTAHPLRVLLNSVAVR